VGVGDPLEAAYALTGTIPAGRYHLVGDGLILIAVDMQFDVLVRPATGPDRVLATFTHHFDPPTGPNAGAAVLFDGDADGLAADATAGDQLVLRMTATNAARLGSAYLPNADGPHTKGRIPSISLPQ
jgi:hypothetical protein